MVTVAEFIEALGEIFPWRLALEWDNAGLQVGDRSSSVSRVLCALDPSLDAVSSAVENGCEVLLTHHPLIFRNGLMSIDAGTPSGKVARLALREGVSIISCHTNADAAEKGIAGDFAAAIGLRTSSPVVPLSSGLLKVVVFVPPSNLEEVFDAMSSAGAGVIGNYTHCSFRVPGKGTFIPREGSSPYSGEVLKLNFEEEVRLEMVVPTHLAAKVVAEMIKVHPYEEVAYDLYPLENEVPWGLGRVGLLPEKTRASQIIAAASRYLGCEPRSFEGDEMAAVEKVAVVPGDASSMVERSISSGALLIIAGEIGYHMIQLALSCGVSVALYGHRESELPFLWIARRELERVFGERGTRLDILTFD